MTLKSCKEDLETRLANAWKAILVKVGSLVPRSSPQRFVAAYHEQVALSNRKKGGQGCLSIWWHGLDMSI